MNTGPAVIVNKSGFLSSLVKGVFGTLTVLVLCGTAVGLYAMRVADKNLPDVVQKLVVALPEWQKAMPPAIADAFNDRRDLEYAKSLDFKTRVEVVGAERGNGVVMVDVTNNGTETVSLMTIRVVVEDGSKERLCELPMTVAAPLSLFDDHGRGPVGPGHTRRIATRLQHVVGEPKVSCEVTELRLWNGPAAKSVTPPLASTAADPS